MNNRRWKWREQISEVRQTLLPIDAMTFVYSECLYEIEQAQLEVVKRAPFRFLAGRHGTKICAYFYDSEFIHEPNPQNPFMPPLN
jgi:hypothetical protein